MDNLVNKHIKIEELVVWEDSSQDFSEGEVVVVRDSSYTESLDMQFIRNSRKLYVSPACRLDKKLINTVTALDSRKHTIFDYSRREKPQTVVWSFNLVNPYMNKELLYTELIVRKDSSTKLLYERYEIRGEVDGGIEAWTTKGILTAYSKDYFSGKVIRCIDSNFYYAFSEDEVEYILARIQVVNKNNKKRRV